MKTNSTVMLALVLALFSSGAFAQDTASENAASECFKNSYASERSLEYEEAMKALLPLKDSPVYRYVVHLRMGWLYYLAGNYANSRNSYQSAIKQSPNSVEARLGYMLPVLAQGNWDEAEATAKQIISVDKNNYYANLRWAYALRMQRKYSQAEAINAQMLMLFPSDLTLMTEMALLKVAMQQREQYKKLFTDIQTLDPDNATAKYYLTKP